MQKAKLICTLQGHWRRNVCDIGNIILNPNKYVYIKCAYQDCTAFELACVGDKTEQLHMKKSHG